MPRRRYTAEDAALFLQENDDLPAESYILENESSDEEMVVEENVSSESENETLSDQEDSNTAEDNFVSRSGDVWYLKPHANQGRNRSADIRRNSGGPTRFAQQRINNLENAWDIIMDDKILQLITNSTNREGIRVLSSSFVKVSVTEMRAFIGLMYLRGIYQGVKEPAQSLWNQEHGRPIFPATMGFQRFKTILRFLRFDDKATRSARYRNDKFAAVREMFTLFQNNIAQLYWPHECITVDEQLFPSRNRCPFLQYMPQKPSKFGIKFWIAADSSNHFVLSVKPYLGKENEVRDGSLGESVVQKLTEDYTNSGCTVVTDNFFTSLKLARTLRARGMTLLGTIRTHRTEIPKELVQKNRPLHSSIFAFHQNKDAVLVSYVAKRNKVVVLLTSCKFRDTVDQSLKRKPHIVLEYNKFKGGVDTVDQMLRHFTTKMASRRWPLAVFCNIIDISALNAFVLWRDIGRSSQTRFQFIYELSLTLISPHQQERAQARSLHPAVRRALTAVDDNNCRIRDSSKRANCQLCDVRNRNRTSNQCDICRKWICGKHVSRMVHLCPKCISD